SRGLSRFLITEITIVDGAFFAKGEPLSETNDLDAETNQVLLKGLKQLSGEILDLIPADTRELKKLVAGIDDIRLLADMAAQNIEMPIPDRQELLEIQSIRTRVLKVFDLLQKRREILRVESDVRTRLSDRMGKLQREALLREQMKSIQEELGESMGEGDASTENPSGSGGTLKDLERKLKDAGMSAETQKLALDELSRLRSLPAQSPETHVIRNYLDLLAGLPWKKVPAPEIDIDGARTILDADHYGLEKVKKRVIEHLSVLKLKKNKRGSILLLVGPPGVGKTSLGESIAKALSRKFVRVSLGGVRDDAEIRGHRRTYVGAMPGRIISAIKRSGERNSVFMLDEIDKLGRGFSGDPASALLEVLDPEQNSTFHDHYLDVPFDLSDIFFIATANSLESVPSPLLDRMEIIELTGYTSAEKLHIAKNHLLPKQLLEHGITPETLRVDDDALLRLIVAYTREAGVRDLERKLAALCRASAVDVVARKETTFEPIRVDIAKVESILGPERFSPEVAERIAPPGVVTGLAWTPHGGEILFIESSTMPGKGATTITGQLGDVMKESAQIALTLVRSKLAGHFKGFDVKKSDLHIHVPAGGIPKDGPSAGTALTVSLASLYSGISVNPKLAMTGEITLRGVVMPVGGIKEKVMAAHRAGIERVLLPRKNQRDLRDIPEEIQTQIKIDWVDTIADVLEIALGFKPKEAPTNLGNLGVEKDGKATLIPSSLV
ncbi:MAG: endopeptidase La, partial [Bdellovibrionota bacterium]